MKVFGFSLLALTFSLSAAPQTLAQIKSPTPRPTGLSSGALAPPRTGGEVRFNGQTVAIGWQHTADNRFLISEIGVTQLLGLQLLSSSDPNLQPVAWYSTNDPNRDRGIARLPVQWRSDQRFFDITDLAQLNDWIVRFQGNNQLEIVTPTSKVNAIAVEKQAWGDRITFTLDDPASYQFDAQSQEFTLTLDALTDGTIAAPWRQVPAPLPIPAPTPSPDPTTPATTPATNPTTTPTQSLPLKAKPPSRIFAPPEIPVTPQLPLPTRPVAPITAPIVPQQVPPPSPFNRIQTLKLETTSTQTTLKLGIPISQRPRVTMLNNPPRLVIDVGNPDLPGRDIALMPGLRWQQLILRGFPVNILEFDPKQPGLNLQPILPNDRELASVATVFQTARSRGAIAAINGGFFNRNNQLPLGAIRTDQTWKSGPILGRGVVAWNPGGAFYFDRLVSQDAITANGQRYPLNTFNSAYLQAGIARYTAEWGLNYSSMTDGEVIATVENGRVIAQVTAEKPGMAIPIPANSYLLVFRSNRTNAAKFPVGTPVDLQLGVVPDVNGYQHVIGGGPLLIKDNQIVLDALGEKFSPAFANELAARSAIGQTATGKILIVAAQNSPTSKGPSLSEIAQIMQSLGAVNALNLDGGSSTTLYLNGQIVDRAPRSSARVHNVLGIFRQP
jgi:hypothetical protein